LPIARAGADARGEGAAGRQMTLDEKIGQDGAGGFGGRWPARNDVQEVFLG